MKYFLVLFFFVFSCSKIDDENQFSLSLEIEDLKKSLRGPISRGEYHKSQKTVFKNKRDFYEKIWLDEDFEMFDKVNPVNEKTIQNLCDII